MNLSTVIEKLQQNPHSSYITYTYDTNENYLGIYELSVSEDDIDEFLSDTENKNGYVSVLFDGGIFYSTCGEQDEWMLKTVYDKIKNCKFYDSSDYPDLSSKTADYVATLLFPQLPDPDTLFSDDERKMFIKKFEELLPGEHKL